MQGPEGVCGCLFHQVATSSNLQLTPTLRNLESSVREGCAGGGVGGQQY